MPLCPCQVSPSLAFLTTPVTYSDCCQPYHDGIDRVDGAKANDAERLMRTRYSAFVLLKVGYIVATTVPAQQDLLDVDAIESWAKETDWAGLDIIQHTPNLGKRHAQVEFKAFYTTSEGTQAHHELSTFVRITDKSASENKERWYFLDPTVAMTMSQKQPCICGSGEKFKRCCGVYI
ncbi:YchJ family protein [Psychrobacter sp. CAL346-MNA-CIBAN-0220]|uniref:YchJ family protein n=1 Tax=Psychrobacter sp. CAL346-MNA-CIBAN-0220 TaxID=3140457 RepID=UPI003316BA52